MVQTRADDRIAEVLVRDDGDGIPPEDEATIFLPYRRSSNAPRTGASVGLGLWVSRQLAEAMGGSLTYERTNGWTEFSLRLVSDSALGILEADAHEGAVAVVGLPDS